MRTHFNNEVDNLRTEINRLAREVLRSVNDTTVSLRDGETVLAAKVAEHDDLIDNLEVHNEEACLKIIALHQPVADDLRYLIVLDKVNHELERIGDLAVTLADIVPALTPAIGAQWSEPLAALVDLSADRLDRAITALMTRDAEAAREIWKQDREINATAADLTQRLRAAVVANEQDPTVLFGLLEAVAHAERMGDHIKNIAKEIIYLVVGEIVRHRGKIFRNTPVG